MIGAANSDITFKVWNLSIMARIVAICKIILQRATEKYSPESEPQQIASDQDQLIASDIFAQIENLVLHQSTSEVEETLDSTLNSMCTMTMLT